MKERSCATTSLTTSAFRFPLLHGNATLNGARSKGFENTKIRSLFRKRVRCCESPNKQPEGGPTFVSPVQRQVTRLATRVGKNGGSSNRGAPFLLLKNVEFGMVNVGFLHLLTNTCSDPHYTLLVRAFWPSHVCHKIYIHTHSLRLVVVA